MTKKNMFMLTAAFLAVAGFYIYLYGGRFRKPVIHISHTIRPMGWTRRRRTAPGPDTENPEIVTFRLAQDYKLTSIKVIPVAELATNKYAHPIWDLTSDSNSAPIQVFSYGSGVRGMHPSVKGAQADPLQPDVSYRLIVESGGLKGEHDFVLSDKGGAGQ